MTGPEPGLRGPVLLVLLLGIAGWMATAHIFTVDEPRLAAKQRLHTQALEERAPDPYQYKLWAISHVLEAAADASGRPLAEVFYANTVLSLLFLVLVHHLWLRSLVGAREALVGALTLGALSAVLFQHYFHHPYEFWGVGAFCLLLRMLAKDVGWAWLALGLLLTGIVWEKHALLALVWGLLQLARRRPFLASFLRGLVLLAAAVALPVGVRLLLGTDRAHVDGDTPWALQDWAKVAWFQLPYVLPFALVLLTTWRRQPALVRLLWLYLPVLASAYASQDFILHETRSFWALAPVFTATLAVALARAPQQASAVQPVPAP